MCKEPEYDYDAYDADEVQERFEQWIGGVDPIEDWDHDAPIHGNDNFLEF